MNTLWGHVAENIADGAVFPAGIHPLKDNKDFLLMLGEEDVLEVGQVPAQFVEVFLPCALVSVEGLGVPGGEGIQIKGGPGGDAVLLSKRMHIGMADP